MRVLGWMGAAVVMCALALPASAQMSNSLTAQEKQEGWVQLFDGKTLNGWTPRGEAKWEVQNGELVAMAGGKPGFLATANSYGNFRLRLDFWTDEEANSGVFLRAPETGAINQGNSFEVNIADTSANWPTGSINEFHKNPAPKTAGKWNTYDITADGDHFVVLLNGEKTADIRGSRLPRGPIGLQYGRGTVKFRNVRILAK